MILLLAEKAERFLLPTVIRGDGGSVVRLDVGNVGEDVAAAVDSGGWSGHGGEESAGSGHEWEGMQAKKKKKKKTTKKKKKKILQ